MLNLNDIARHLAFVSKSPIVVLAGYLSFAHTIHPPTSFRPSGHTLSGPLALSIRRGDTIDYCIRLVNWFEEFAGLQDKFFLPTLMSSIVLIVHQTPTYTLAEKCKKLYE